MNVWIINHYAGTLDYGMEHRHFLMSQELVKKGNKVLIISSAYTHLLNKFPKINNKHFFVENIEGVEYLWIKTPKYRGNGLKRIINMLIFSLKLFLYKNKKKLLKPDIVIPSSPHPFVFLNGLHIAKKFKAKVFLEVRDIWPLSIIELTNTKKSHPLNILFSIIEKFSYKKADVLISPLPNFIEHVEKNLNIHNKPFYCIPNGLSLNNFKNLKQKNIRDKEYSEKFIVGFAGTIGKSNSIDLLVKAAQRLLEYDIHFVIIGDGVEKKELEDYCKKNKISNIDFIGRVDRTEVYNYLLNFNLLYIGAPKSKLYKYGVAPIKIAEYMMVEKPILNAMEAFNDPVKEANCGISVKAENIEAIKDGILKIFNMHPEERLKLGKNGKKYILNNFTYKKIVDSLLEITNL